MITTQNDFNRVNSTQDSNKIKPSKESPKSLGSREVNDGVARRLDFDKDIFSLQMNEIDSDIFNAGSDSPHSDVSNGQKLQTKLDKSLSSLLNDTKLYLENDINRFNKIMCMKKTAVGNNIHANKIVVKDTNIAIACQYPMEAQIFDHLSFLLNSETKKLVILTTPEEIENNKLSRYFNKNETYYTACGNQFISTKANEKTENDNFLNIDLVIEQVKGEKRETQLVEVLHIKDCKDMSALNSQHTSEIINFTGSNQSDSFSLPVIHCRAGVGRTGQAIAELAMNKLDTNVSLEKIISDMRLCRNKQMVFTKEQFEALIENKSFDRPIYSSSF